MKKLFVLFVVTLTVFAGCNVIDNIKTTCRVVKEVRDGNPVTYSYSDDGLLTNAVYSNPDMLISVGYVSQNKVSKIEYYNKSGDTLLFYTNYNWLSTKTVESETFFKTYDGQWWQADKQQFELNDDGDPVKISYYERDNDAGDWYVDHYEEYIWSKGNIVRAEYFTLDENTGDFKNDETYIIDYDQKQNAWRGLSIKAVMTFDNGIFCTSNNPVKITLTDNETGTSQTTEYTYQYNSDNLPVSYTTKTTDASGNVTSGISGSFEYECK